MARISTTKQTHLTSIDPAYTVLWNPADTGPGESVIFSTGVSYNNRGPDFVDGMVPIHFLAEAERTIRPVTSRSR